MTMTAGWSAERATSPLTEREFAWITKFLRNLTGIELKAGKESLVMGRLERRLRHYGMQTYTEYFALLGLPEAPEETRMAIDLMTTNETYFFREPLHFDLLPDLLPGRVERPIRVWSAASSSGEEAYSVALTLADCLPSQQAWEVVGTDLSTRVLETARRALYPVEAAERIPERLLTHCRRGRGEYEGLLTVRPELRARVTFRRANLTRPLRDAGQYDVIFLRNILIYFNPEVKRQVVTRVAATLRPGGALIVGLAETLTGLDTGLLPVAASVYRRPGA